MAVPSRPGWSAAALAVAFLMVAAGAAASVGVSVDVRGDVPADVHLAAWPLGADRNDRPAVTATLPAGKRETPLDLSGLARWRLEASAEGFWSPPVEVSVPEQQQVRVTLWPAAKVTGKLQPPPEAAIPRELRLRLLERSQPSSPGASGASSTQPAEAEVLCPASEKGHVECLTPAGRWDLRAKAEGFAPHYLWDLALQPRQTKALGSLHLRKGTSVLGRIVTEAGPVDPAQIAVELRPVVYGGFDAPHGLGPQLQRLVLSARVNPWGYFHFEAVPVGSYTLEGRQSGFEPARVSPLAVREGDDLELGDALVLRPARHFEVAVDPPRGPRQKPWRLLLLSVVEGTYTSVAEGETDRFGRWRSPALPAGIYIVQVLGGDDSFYWKEVALAEPAQELAIELPLVNVVGTVRFGEEPLAGRLVFGGRRGGMKIEAASDAEGRFALVLPRDGDWIVDVEADEPSISASALEVEVRRRRDRRPTNVEIEVPDTVIRGTVTDDEGKPLPGARVHLDRFRPSYGGIERTTGRDGAFAIHGQLPGRCFVWARAMSYAGETSETTEILLAEGTETPPLNLVVEKKRVLRGRVTSAAGAPAAGAQVFANAFPAAGVPTQPGWDQTAADLDGAFQLKLRRKTAEVQVMVLAPGYPLAVWRVRLREDTTALTLRLGEAHGTLHLPRTDGNLLTPLFPLVLVDGEPLAGWLLRNWGQAGGSPSVALETVAAMPPGSYRYCELEPQEALLVLWGAAAPSESACSEGYLAPGGELTLRSPRAATAAKRPS